MPGGSGGRNPDQVGCHGHRPGSGRVEGPRALRTSQVAMAVISPATAGAPARVWVTRNTSRPAAAITAIKADRRI